MTIIRRILFCALLGAALPGWSQDGTPETPQDYAWGAALETTTASPLYQVTLPERIYTDSVASDLRDVRVFNQQGHAVPFTLIPAVQKQTPPRTLPLRLFALEPVPDNNAASETLWLRSQDGIEIRLDGEGKKTTGKSYLLTLPETQKDEFPLSQLKLTWNAVPANWQGRTDVYVSSDLKNWTLYGRDMPLMDLTSGSGADLQRYGGEYPSECSGENGLLVGAGVLLATATAAGVSDDRSPGRARAAAGDRVPQRGKGRMATAGEKRDLSTER